jgi:predicted O-methyltransferase YrrM
MKIDMTSLTHTKPGTLDFNFLQQLRYRLGPIYGSEDLCVLLYSLVKRQKPRVVVELGTGFGVTTAWIAAAMTENGFGTIYTVDNGTHFESSRQRNKFDQLDGMLTSLAPISHAHSFFAEVFERAGVAQCVRSIEHDIDLVNLAWLDAEINKDHENQPIDVVFSDFNHSVQTICQILASFLPRMADNASIFIDSASTKMVSYYMLEHLMKMLENNKVPIEILAMASDTAQKEQLARILQTSVFKLTHLIERQERAQNSTAWLSVSRASLLPAGAIMVGLQ